MAKKKTAKSTAKKTAKKTAPKRFSFVNEVYDGVLGLCEVTRAGTVRIKKSEMKELIENAFNHGAKLAASGERVRFPVIGSLVRRDVKARKAGKGINPFTGEETMVKARPASKKPRWSFPKVMKETFGNKRNW